MEAYIDDVFENANRIIPVGDGKNFIIAEREGENYHPSAIIRWESDGYYSLVTAFPYNRKYIEKQEKKGSSSLGRGPQAPAPVQDPRLPDAAINEPDGNAGWRTGKDESFENNIPPQIQGVNDAGGGDKNRHKRTSNADLGVVS
ncbi:MAG: hypothetical protein FWG09_01425 [Synergistaceae bacterium]|nr:hypothetical protein [Synergistaceae bacterium]